MSEVLLCRRRGTGASRASGENMSHLCRRSPISSVYTNDLCSRQRRLRPDTGLTRPLPP